MGRTVYTDANEAGLASVTAVVDEAKAIFGDDVDVELVVDEGSIELRVAKHRDPAERDPEQMVDTGGEPDGLEDAVGVRDDAGDEG